MDGRRVVAKQPHVEGRRVVAERAAGVATSAVGGAAAGAALLRRTNFKSNDLFFEELLVAPPLRSPTPRSR